MNIGRVPFNQYSVAWGGLKIIRRMFKREESSGIKVVVLKEVVYFSFQKAQKIKVVLTDHAFTVTQSASCHKASDVPTSYSRKKYKNKDIKDS